MRPQTGQGEEMQPPVQYERGWAILTGEDELLFVLEIAGGCQRRWEKVGLSSGEQHKCKVCREWWGHNGGRCSTIGKQQEGAFWWLAGLKYTQLALAYDVFCSLRANKCFIPQRKCWKTRSGYSTPAPSSWYLSGWTASAAVPTVGRDAGERGAWRC